MRLRYRLMLIPLMGAGACAFFGLREYSLSARSSREPEEISLRDLIRRGPEGNPNIVLKDFTIFDDYVGKKKLTGRWTKVWVPIVPTDADEDSSGRPAAIRAFLFCEEGGSDNEIRQRFGRPKVRGMVNPDAPKPGIIGSVLLERSYPGTDSSKCLIIEEGREPAGVLKLGLFGAGFIFFAVATAGVWYLARLMDQAPADSKVTDTSHPGAAQQEGGPESIFLE
jgi:hypothetical protein